MASRQQRPPFGRRLRPPHPILGAIAFGLVVGAGVGPAMSVGQDRSEASAIDTAMPVSDPTPTRIEPEPTFNDDTRPAIVVDTITVPVSSIQLVKGRSVSLPVVVRGTFPVDSELVAWRASNRHIRVAPPNPIMRGPSDGTFRATLNNSTVLRITGIGLGETTLKLSAPGTAKASVKVRVVTTAVRVKSLAIAKKQPKLNVGAATVLKTRLSPATATGAIVRWTSSRPKVATVDDDGRLLARAPGRTVITAQAGSQKAKFKLTVQ
ncbi:MAG: Ig-like domain-containing protein [Bifidobacteriaceae bacterium]|jgi:uncharacterized protein YjdB|nr:Ig-like domain-containing protein [Bifidobacteriaceae bacterium]